MPTRSIRSRRVRRAAHPTTDVRALAASERLILRLLRDHGDTYGMRLVHLSAGALTEHGVYVTLGRMLEKDFVESWHRRDDGEMGAVRRVYRTTSHGLRMLEATEAFERTVRGGA